MVRESLGVARDVLHLVEGEFVVVRFHVAVFVAEVHLVPERGHVVACPLPDKGWVPHGVEIYAVAVLAVARPAVLVKELCAALDVRPLYLALLVKQLVHEVRHALVLAGERVSWRPGFRRIYFLRITLRAIFSLRLCLRDLRRSRGIPGSYRCRPVEGGEQSRDKQCLAHLHAENIKNARSAQFVSLQSAVRNPANCGL